MKHQSIIFLFLFLAKATYSQVPHLTGTVTISIKKGTINCDVILSNIPDIEKYTIWLNTGFNLVAVTDSGQQIKYTREKQYNNKSSECFQYLLTKGEDTINRLPKTLRFQYTGAFPVYNDTSKMYDMGDWKGNIALNGQTLRMTEQSGWYPIIYDKGNDVVLDKYTYSINVISKEGSSTYVMVTCQNQVIETNFLLPNLCP